MVMTAPRITSSAPRSSDAGELAAIEAAKVRNRKKLIEALRAGLRAEMIAPGAYLVESGEKNGAWYRCRVALESGDNLYYGRFTCSCRWARSLEVAWQPYQAPAAPCKHCLLLYWFALDADRQLRLMQQDPELAIACDAWRVANIPTTPQPSYD